MEIKPPSPDDDGLLAGPIPSGNRISATRGCSNTAADWAQRYQDALPIDRD